MFFRKYDPLHFVKAYEEHGDELEHFLSKPENLGRLDAAVEMRRPAAQAIAVPLLEAFGKRAQDFRFRQLVGHMLRHLMAERGCEIDQTDVRIPNGVLFTRAARYRRKTQRALTAGR